MGDVGYLDPQQRFWFCGRKSQRVILAEKTLYTAPTEAVMNQHPKIDRCALVPLLVDQQPCAGIVVQMGPDHFPPTNTAYRTETDEILQYAAQNELTADIQYAFIRKDLPVDIRHNAKISRGKLARWAQDKLASRSPQP